MEIEYLLFLEGLKNSAGDFIASAIGFLSNIGSEKYFMAITALFYWCINKKHGIFSILTFGITGFFNTLLKLSFCVYRPYLMNQRLYHLPKAGGYSFPSGHASNAAGYLLPIGRSYLKTKIIPILSVLGVLAVCLSRNFLGVHTLKDVLAGVLLGIICLIITDVLLRKIEKLKYGDFMLMAAVIILSVLAAVYVNHKPYPTDLNAAGELLVNPKNSFGDLYGRIGLLCGAITGFVLEKRFIRFKVPNTIICKILYYIAGLFLINLIERALVDSSFFKIMLNQFLLMLFITAIFPLMIKLFGRCKTLIKQKYCHR